MRIRMSGSCQWSAQVPLDVQGQVVWPGERSAADVAFERLDPGVFPLRGCSDNISTATFTNYFEPNN